MGRKMGGAGVTLALALGLRDALQPKKAVPVVIPDPGGEPLDDDIVLFFHPQVPEATLVLLRSGR
jgi:hypothetical protein